MHWKQRWKALCGVGLHISLIFWFLSFSVSLEQMHSTLFILRLFCYLAGAAGLYVKKKKTPSDLCVRSVPYVHHIWSLLCHFTFSPFQSNSIQNSPNVHKFVASVQFKTFKTFHQKSSHFRLEWHFSVLLLILHICYITFSKTEQCTGDRLDRNG